MFNKRGISPLIATVLLVSFVVVLSGVIMFWGKQYVTELMDKRGEVSAVKLECEQVEIEIIKATETQIEIRNASPFKLSGFILKYMDGATEQINNPVKPFTTSTITLTEPTQRLNLIPTLRPQGLGAPPVPCSNQHKIINIGG
jgi:flagellin-like protein